MEDTIIIPNYIDSTFNREFGVDRGRQVACWTLSLWPESNANPYVLTLSTRDSCVRKLSCAHSAFNAAKDNLVTHRANRAGYICHSTTTGDLTMDNIDYVNGIGNITMHWPCMSECKLN